MESINCPPIDRTLVNLICAVRNKDVECTSGTAGSGGLGDSSGGPGGSSGGAVLGMVLVVLGMSWGRFDLVRSILELFWLCGY